MQSCSEGAFFERSLQVITEEVLTDEGVTGALEFLFDDPGLFRLVEAITGCVAIGHFAGRIYRLRGESGHHVDWHTDVVDGRLVALSLNLSGETFEGGVLEMREKIAGGRPWKVENPFFGDAVLFRIAPGLEHRVTAVIGPSARTTFAGFFHAFNQRGPEHSEDFVLYREELHGILLGRSPSQRSDGVAVARGVVTRRDGDSVVLYNSATGVRHRLDPIGSRMWHCLASSGSIARTKERMLDEFEVTERELEIDLAQIVRSLMATGLLIPVQSDRL
jgi:hypothetical protein